MNRLTAGAALGDVQKRVYVDPNHPDLGGDATDQNGPDSGQHHGQHHVILNRRTCTDFLHCGGSMINQDWVITAAHCDCWFLKAIVNNHPDRAKRDVQRIAEKYYCCGSGEVHDIMLLKLKDRHHQLTVINLPDPPCTAPAADEHVLFYGWMEATLTPVNSLQRMYPKPAKRLRFGKTIVVECQPGRLNDCPPFNSNFIAHHCVCVQRPGVSANAGDSGGSLVWNKKLYGVLKAGSEYLNVSPQYFMDICYPLYRDWIKQQTGL